MLYGWLRKQCNHPAQGLTWLHQVNRTSSTGPYRSGCQVVFAFATEAAMELRLIEQACGCSTVRDGGGASSCVLVSAAGTRVESACRHAPRTKHLQVVLPLRRKPPWSSD